MFSKVNQYTRQGKDSLEEMKLILILESLSGEYEFSKRSLLSVENLSAD